MMSWFEGLWMDYRWRIFVGIKKGYIRSDPLEWKHSLETERGEPLDRGISLAFSTIPGH
jgi:hypothetical protein